MEGDDSQITPLLLEVTSKAKVPEVQLSLNLPLPCKLHHPLMVLSNSKSLLVWRTGSRGHCHWTTLVIVSCSLILTVLELWILLHLTHQKILLACFSPSVTEAPWRIQHVTSVAKRLPARVPWTSITEAIPKRDRSFAQYATGAFPPRGTWSSMCWPTRCEICPPSSLSLTPVLPPAQLHRFYLLDPCPHDEDWGQRLSAWPSTWSKRLAPSTCDLICFHLSSTFGCPATEDA